ncbi:hypothetical protein [Halomicrobium katesii]|uniref:hypothetical protein n=1 Tax=Halomicrobium katesii TaxID=437163 RepID=UPI00036B4383|nr:hypothetical protein [Halomicrobium katesii]
MESVGGSRDVIGNGIELLQQRHGPFPVNQTTLSLSPDAYDAAVERACDGFADVYVRVENDDGEVLHVQGEDRRRVPRCVGGSETPLSERARDAVKDATGVSCTIDGIVRVTIAGVRNAEDTDAETVYRLLVLADATYDGGQAERGVWRVDPKIPEFV